MRMPYLQICSQLELQSEFPTQNFRPRFLSLPKMGAAQWRTFHQEEDYDAPHVDVDAVKANLKAPLPWWSREVELRMKTSADVKVNDEELMWYIYIKWYEL
jgi:hypothetical protein